MLHPLPHQYSDDKPIVEMRHVTCGYDGVIVLRDITLSIMRGEFVGLLGPSGSGKTTLLRSILASAHIYEGEVLVEGKSVKSHRPRIGYVPQLETIDWNFPVTVEQVILMGRTPDNNLFPWFDKRDRETTYSIMDRLGIGHLKKRHIRELSGGQQQRVFLARALVSNPNILLLDEPSSGVDLKTRDEIMHLLDELNHQDITIIMTTHEINAVAAHLPWVVCLNGTIIAAGPPSNVFTTETLKLTYGADLPIMQHEGMTLVGELPHRFGRDERRSK